MNNKLRLYAIVILSLLFFALSYIYTPQILAIIGSLLLAILGCWIYTIIDDYILVGINTLEELKNGNKAVAIILEISSIDKNGRKDLLELYIYNTINLNYTKLQTLTNNKNLQNKSSEIQEFKSRYQDELNIT